MRLDLSIDSKRAALILVDLQEEERRDPYYVVPDLDAVLANARKLLEAARANGLRVMHVAYKRDFRAVPRRPFEPVTADGRPTYSDVASPNLANRLNGGAVATAGSACRLISGETANVWVAEKQVPILFSYEDAERHYEEL